MGSESLLQATIERILPQIPLRRITLVANISQEDSIRLELQKKGWEDIDLLLGPQSRNTAIAVGLAAVRLAEKTNQGIIAIFPADHFIQYQDRFLQSLERSVPLAQEGYIVTLGINPTRPDTGYGYIKIGEPLNRESTIYQAEKFIEKLDIKDAKAFLEEGCYYWNSGIFLFRIDVLWEAFSLYLPDFHKMMLRLLNESPPPSIESIYQGFPSISIDHAIMGKPSNVAVVPVDMGWSDVRTWGELYELFEKDRQGNVILGSRVVELENQNTLVFSQNRVVAAMGLNDIIVVDTTDATLVCHRDRASEVIKIVAELSRRNFSESVQHPKVDRPWGSYTVIDSGPSYKVKQVVVEPGKKLSLQLHRQRAEHWMVVHGTARVTIGNETKILTPNESAFVPPIIPHRLENYGTDLLYIIEIQTGSYLEEDDIIRLEDDFWRISHERNK
jgi:mannose-1-phosphate guanylyltransferase/mannose-6-phosphate isomerase